MVVCGADANLPERVIARPKAVAISRYNVCFCGVGRWMLPGDCHVAASGRLLAMTWWSVAGCINFICAINPNW